MHPVGFACFCTQWRRRGAVRGKNVPSFLWTTIHFEGINYAFSFHCAWVLVACQLCSVLVCPALPNTSLPPSPYSRSLLSSPRLFEWLKSAALCKKFGLQPLFGTRKQSSRVVWQQVWPTRRLAKWLTDWLTDLLSEELPLAESAVPAREGFSLAAFGASV